MFPSRSPGIVLAGVLGALILLPATVQAKPCGEHKGERRAACMEQQARDRMLWPPEPVRPFEVRRRVGGYNWSKAYRVSVCETGHTINWHLTGSYRGALGMYASTWQYGADRTGYDGDTWAEQVAIAVAAHPITGGWDGWGCRNA